MLKVIRHFGAGRAKAACYKMNNHDAYAESGAAFLSYHVALRNGIVL